MNPGKCLLALLALLFLIAPICGNNLAHADDPENGPGSSVAATTNRSFDAAVNTTLDCLSRRDWHAFGKIACPQIVCVLAVRVTPGMISPAQRVYLQHSATHALDPTKNSSLTLESLLEVDSRKPLSPSDNPAFVSFCDAVKSSIDEANHRSSRIRKGMNLRAGDSFVMIGPAVQCHTMSDHNWRIELQQTPDGWRVSRLIVTTH